MSREKPASPLSAVIPTLLGATTIACLIVADVAHAQVFSYPVGNRNPGEFTEANDGDGWYNAQDFQEFNIDFGGYHAGEDWNAESGGNSDVGSAVYAIGDGQVTLAREVFSQSGASIGDAVAIEHQRPEGPPLYSLYLHVTAAVQVGETVQRDQVIGTIADLSAASLFSHLHFEIRTLAVPQQGSLYPNALPNGYYATFQAMDLDGLTVDPSDLIDASRQGSGGGKQLAQCALYVTDMGEEIETFGCQMPGPIRGPNNEGDFWGLTFGPDGKLYVCSSLFGPDRVLRFDPLTREPCPGPLGSLDSADFVPPDDNRNGGLRDGRGLTFGPDGNLYVSSGTDEVLRYHGVTGIFLDPFVSRRAGGMDDPTDLAFGPDGNLYVCCLRGGTGLSESQVLVFDGVTGCFLRALVRDDPGTPIDETGGLKEAWGIAFDAQDRVYLTSHLNNKVLRYDRVTGAVIDCFVQPNAGGLDRPFGLEFGPDGDLFVASNNTANSGFSDDFILRYDGQTGVFKNVHVELPGGTATYLKFRPPGLVTRPTLLVGLGENRVSRSASDPVSLCARFVNKPVPRRVLVFVWIEDPDRIVHPLALPQNFQICPERPQQGQIPPGAGPVVSGSLDFSTSFRIGTAGAGLLTEDGEYAVGARVVDAFTGVVHSSARVPFVVVP